MRALTWQGLGDVRVENVPDPVLQDPTDAIVRVTRACVCGSDLHPFHTMAPTPEGSTMGHEFIGIVEEVGADRVVQPLRGKPPWAAAEPAAPAMRSEVTSGAPCWTTARTPVAPV